MDKFKSATILTSDKKVYEFLRVVGEKKKEKEALSETLAVKSEKIAKLEKRDRFMRHLSGSLKDWQSMSDEGYDFTGGYS